MNDSEDDHSNKNVDKSNPKRYPLVATHSSDGNERKMTDTDTTKGNYPHTLLTNREIPAIILGVILLINQTTVNGVATSGRDLHAVRAVLRNKIITGATRSAAVVLKYPLVLNWKDTSETIPVDRNTVGIPPITTTQVWPGTGPSFPPIRIGSHKIEGPRQSIITYELSNAESLETSFDRVPAKHRYPTPS